MNERIIYTNLDGLTSYITPIMECGLSLEEIAAKDVPAGSPFQIINESALIDREIFSAAIEVDPANADGIGADYGIGSINAVIGYTEKNEAVTQPIISVDGIKAIDIEAKPKKHKISIKIIPNAPNIVTVNMPKAIVIAHGLRRVKRDADFAPHDEIIAKQIPGAGLDTAEPARQAIRDADAIVQIDIDVAADVTALRTVLSGAGIIV